MIERGACAFKQNKDRKNYRYLNIWLERYCLLFRHFVAVFVAEADYRFALVYTYIHVSLSGFT